MTARAVHGGPKDVCLLPRFACLSLTPLFRANCVRGACTRVWGCTGGLARLLGNCKRFAHKVPLCLCANLVWGASPRVVDMGADKTEFDASNLSCSALYRADLAHPTALAPHASGTGGGGVSGESCAVVEANCARPAFAGASCKSERKWMLKVTQSGCWTPRAWLATTCIPWNRSWEQERVTSRD